MIRVHRLDGKEFVVNADHIETVEATPDTVLSLVSGRKHVVAEDVDQVIRLVVAFHQERSAGPERRGERAAAGALAAAAESATGLAASGESAHRRGA